MKMPLTLIDQAEQLYAEWDASGEDASALIDVIARAVLAERERCAKIAERFDPGAYCESITQALDACAGVIRSGNRRA